MVHARKKTTKKTEKRKELKELHYTETKQTITSTG